MLTFLELYQTLLGFVFFKLYTDAGLVYPPPLDTHKDEGGAGVGAFSLQEANPNTTTSMHKKKLVEVDGKKVSGKDVRQTIKSIAASAPQFGTADVNMVDADAYIPEADEEFVAQPSSSDPSVHGTLPTLQSLTALPQSISTDLFVPYTFFLSRESSRPIFEFIIRSFGGRIGWPASSGSGSPFEETDDSITHVIIDRPVVEKPSETVEERERRLRRKYVQPQWVVDCINAGKILLEEPYGQGKSLPPHLSPFGEYEGAYDPTSGLTDGDAVVAEAEDDEESEQEDADVSIDDDAEANIALRAAVSAEDPAALRVVELAAEAAGVDYGIFEKEVTKSRKKAKKADLNGQPDGEKDMNKMMMSSKKRKLYERMKHGERRREAEVTLLINITVNIVHWPVFTASEPGVQTANHCQSKETTVQTVESLMHIMYISFHVVFHNTFEAFIKSQAKLSCLRLVPIRNTPTNHILAKASPSICPSFPHALDGISRQIAYWIISVHSAPLEEIFGSQFLR
jgi:pescadillo